MVARRKHNLLAIFALPGKRACLFPMRNLVVVGECGRKPGREPQREASFYPACYQRICLCFAPLCIVINRAHACITALWRSWLARRPVTAEVAGSSPVRVAGWFSSQVAR